MHWSLLLETRLPIGLAVGIDRPAHQIAATQPVTVVGTADWNLTEQGTYHPARAVFTALR